MSVFKSGLFTRRRVRTIVMLLVFVLVFFAMRAYQQRDLVRKEMPELTGTSFTGHQVSLAGITEPTLVYFWAGWCPVCKLQSPVIRKLAQDHPVIAVAMQTEEEEIREFLAEAQASLPVLPDPGGIIARRFGVRGVPAIFIVSPGGEIRFSEVGYTTGPGLRLRLWWAARDKKKSAIVSTAQDSPT